MICKKQRRNPSVHKDNEHNLATNLTWQCGPSSDPSFTETKQSLWTIGYPIGNSHKHVLMYMVEHLLRVHKHMLTGWSDPHIPFRNLLRVYGYSTVLRPGQKQHWWGYPLIHWGKLQFTGTQRGAIKLDQCFFCPSWEVRAWNTTF